MKRTLLSLFVLVCFSQIAFCESLSSQGKYTLKLNLQGASDISARANQGNSGSSSESDTFQNPMINSTMQGFGNIMRGGDVDARSLIEQSKLQMDYAKQQTDRR